MSNGGPEKKATPVESQTSGGAKEAGKASRSKDGDEPVRPAMSAVLQTDAKPRGIENGGSAQPQGEIDDPRARMIKAIREEMKAAEEIIAGIEKAVMSSTSGSQVVQEHGRILQGYALLLRLHGRILDRLEGYVYQLNANVATIAKFVGDERVRREKELEEIRSLVVASRGVETASRAPVHPTAAPAPGAAGIAGRPRLLVVDDNPTSRFLAVELLKKLGHSADAASDGKAGIEMVKRGGYDLVFMDLLMDGMSGVETTAEIRRQEGNSTHLPIIAITAEDAEGEREKCLAAGMDDYLAKPLSLEGFQAVLARWTK